MSELHRRRIDDTSSIEMDEVLLSLADEDPKSASGSFVKSFGRMMISCCDSIFSEDDEPLCEKEEAALKNLEKTRKAIEDSPERQAIRDVAKSLDSDTTWGKIAKIIKRFMQGGKSIWINIGMVAFFIWDILYNYIVVWLKDKIVKFFNAVKNLMKRLLSCCCCCSGCFTDTRDSDDEDEEDTVYQKNEPINTSY